VVEFGLLWMSSVWLGWKIIRKFLFTLREDDPDENKESTLNNGESSGSASQLSFTNLFCSLNTNTALAAWSPRLSAGRAATLTMWPQPPPSSVFGITFVCNSGLTCLSRPLLIVFGWWCWIDVAFKNMARQSLGLGWAHQFIGI